MTQFSEKTNFIWSVAELLRGDYKQSEYGKVILPFTVMRRLDCLLEDSKEAVLERAKTIPASTDEAIREAILNRASGYSFHNSSKFTLSKLRSDPDKIKSNLLNYINGFSEDTRDIFLDKFDFVDQIDRLDKANLLFMIVSKFCEIDLHPKNTSELEMGYIFEELIRRFSEQSNETAGEHFTPREVIRLMVNLLFLEDGPILSKKGIIRTVYDPACGTGGMLSVAEEYMRELNPDARLVVFGQELNNESCGVCKSDMLIKGQDPSHIKYGNSFTQDGLAGEHFDYMLSNPPFGVEWKKAQKEITDEHKSKGDNGRFGAGLPRISDGSLLFLQHMISKLKPEGGRIAIVFNGSPLFTGGAESGESEIRRWLVQNDWLEAIISLPDQLFYNTSITTYIWIITNRKSTQRKGKVQLINASVFYNKLRKNLGEKRKEITPDQIDEITRVYGNYSENELSKIIDNEDLAYIHATVERPLRLVYQITEENVEKLKEATAFKNLLKTKKHNEEALEEVRAGEELQTSIVNVLRESEQPDKKVYSRDAFTQELRELFASKNIALNSSLLKAIVDKMAIREEDGEIVKKPKAEYPDPDPALRDYENIPLKVNVDTYYQKEVKPYIPDAWIDTSKNKLGYEIPFNRYFYKYKPLKPLDELIEELGEMTPILQQGEL
jgi:type I restriction enzyme M protein